MKNVFQRATDWVEEDSKFYENYSGKGLDEHEKFKMRYSYAHGWQDALRACKKLFDYATEKDIPEILDEIRKMGI